MAITREKLIAWQNEVREHGMDSGQLSAAGTAIKEIAILTGHRIERSEVGLPGEFDQLDDNALETLVKERFARAVREAEAVR
jgi:hypothetical protein